MTPTPEQLAILEEMEHGTGNCMVRARAGTGKTTAILMAVDVLRRTRPRAEITVCAYNKAIAKEVGEKLKANGHTDWKLTQASTVHSLGFGLIRHAFNPTVDKNKVRDLVDELATGDLFYKEYRTQIMQLVGLAKQAGVGFFDDAPIGDKHVWYSLAEHYDVNSFDDTTVMDGVVDRAQKVYKDSLNKTDVIDFDDMVLWPLIRNMVVRFQKDVMFVDEAQDLSPARQALIRKFVKPEGRIIIVGDDKQAIYGFSGADADALDNLAESLNTKLLPLTVSWRCPKTVIELAQQLVPDIESAPNAPQGMVGSTFVLPEELGHESAILCRNTAPLIDTAYALIRQGTACKVEGRDIGEGLKVLFQRWKVKTLSQFSDRLDHYRDREIQKAQAKGKDDRIQAIVDKCDTAKVIMDLLLADGKQLVSDAVRFIDDLFADGNDEVLTLATYHRSKGREWERVILIDHVSYCPSRYAKQEWQLVQEDNLAYVAFTRAKAELLFWTKGEASVVGNEPQQESQIQGL